jgi:menaquinone-dependent protoporphyrinogen oxidase
VLTKEALTMRVLVTAASRYGATAGIAEAIGRHLEDEGLDVDVAPIDEVDNLKRYDAAVLGSGVYAGRWLKPARRFADDHASELASKATWLFSSGPIGDPPKPEDAAAVRIDDIVESTGAREHRLFAGKLDKSRMTFADRAIVAAVRSPEGDFRDWEAIAEWANDIAEALKASMDSTRDRKFSTPTASALQ